VAVPQQATLVCSSHGAQLIENRDDIETSMPPGRYASGVGRGRIRMDRAAACDAAALRDAEDDPTASR
jgi:hypothetical protein